MAINIYIYRSKFIYFKATIISKLINFCKQCDSTLV